ncbi:unnamed protein product [Auanema sp. JU1783]|nr:unnamed protein product [Auanema sp. JU1783]
MLLSTLAALVCVVSSHWTINLEYSFDDFAHSFPLGVVDLKKQFDGNYTALFKGNEDTSYVKRLNENVNAPYRVKAVSSTKPSVPLYSTSKACLILQSNLYHHIWVTVDPDMQVTHAVTVFPDIVAAGGQLDSENCVPTSVQKGKIQGVVHVSNKRSLPLPDTLSFVQKVEKERKARQNGAEADNRSFLAKYWMYIVPVVLFMFISNAVAPEGGQGEGQ